MVGGAVGAAIGSGVGKKVADGANSLIGVRGVSRTGGVFLPVSR